MRAIIYLRISTYTQNFDIQKKICLLTAKNLGIKKNLIFQDIISGSSEVFKRPGLMDALLNLKKDDVFIVSSKDRLARSIFVISSIEAMIKKSNAKLIVSDQQNLKLNHFELYNLNIIAQQEIISIRKNNEKILKEKKKKNQIIGNIKRGYKISQDKIHLEKDLDEQKRIRKIKNLKKEGCSIKKIAEIINRNDLCNRNKKQYNVSQIKKILAPKKRSNNPQYGVTINEKQMIQTINQLHSEGISLRKIVALVHQLGYKTRKDTPLQLTQIARIVKNKQSQFLI